MTDSQKTKWGQLPQRTHSWTFLFFLLHYQESTHHISIPFRRENKKKNENVLNLTTDLQQDKTGIVTLKTKQLDLLFFIFLATLQIIKQSNLYLVSEKKKKEKKKNMFLKINHYQINHENNSNLNWQYFLMLNSHVY